jgi:hypothetical protein
MIHETVLSIGISDSATCTKTKELKRGFSKDFLLADLTASTEITGQKHSIPFFVRIEETFLSLLGLV